MRQELNPIGAVLQLYMQRAGIPGPAELAQKATDRGLELSEEDVTETMTYGGEYPAFYSLMRPQVTETLGLNGEELFALIFASLETPDARGARTAEALWWAKRAMARKSRKVPLEELTGEEIFSESHVWGKVRQRLADARDILKRRWVFEEEGEEIVSELDRLLEEKLLPLVQTVNRRDYQLRYGEEKEEMACG